MGRAAAACSTRRLQAFQYANPHYPNIDDTAVVVMAMDHMRRLTDSGVRCRDCTRA